MRQLTSLDAQFLALENPRQAGHVGSLAILDPSTAPSGKLGCPDVKALLRERLPLLPPLRWRLAEVPLGLDYPYWVDDGDFDLDYHVRELALANPGTDAQLAEQTARIMSRPPAVGALRDRGARVRRDRRAHEDPPRGHRRAVGSRDHGPAARPGTRGSRAARAGAQQRGPHTEPDGAARARIARRPALSGADAALASRRDPEPR